MIKKTFLTLLLTVVSFSAPVLAQTNAEIQKLASQRSQLERKVVSLFYKLRLKSTDEMDALSQKHFMKTKEWNKARRDHPTLKPLFKKADEAQSRMVKARIAKDKEAGKKATSDYSDARRELEKEASKLNDFDTLKKEMAALDVQLTEKRIEILSTDPKGKVLADEIKALDAKIKALGKN